MTDKTTNETNRLLKVIIGLLIREQGAESSALSLRDKVAILNDLGLAPIEIAEILGRSGNHINKELSEMRKLSKSKK